MVMAVSPVRVLCITEYSNCQEPRRARASPGGRRRALPALPCPAAETRGELLHRVVDRAAPGAGRRLGDDRIGAAGEQRCDGAVIVLGIELAVAGIEQLGDLAHHPLL